MTLADALPPLNAALNATSGVLLFAAWRAIRARRVDLHWKLMVAALAASALFLVFYLTRFALTGAHRYPAADWTRTVYYVVLASHSLLATVILPLIARTLYLAARRRPAAHRRIARVTLPLWGYVSVTGVAVYVMLYHLGPARVP